LVGEAFARIFWADFQDWRHFWGGDDRGSDVVGERCKTGDDGCGVGHVERQEADGGRRGAHE
jgi:hypothetical protein